MPRTKQKLKTRSKRHIKQTLALRKRKNKLKARRRKGKSRGRKGRKR